MEKNRVEQKQIVFHYGFSIHLCFWEGEPTILSFHVQEIDP